MKFGMVFVNATKRVMSEVAYSVPERRRGAGGGGGGGGLDMYSRGLSY